MAELVNSVAVLASWLESYCEVLPSLAENYANTFLSHGISSIPALQAYVAEHPYGLVSLGVDSHDVEEILEALHRATIEAQEEAFDNRSSWHMRTLMAECVGIVDRLKAAIDGGRTEDVVETLHLMAGMGENSRDLQLGLMRAAAYEPIIAVGQSMAASELVAEAVLRCISAFCHYGADKSQEVTEAVTQFGSSGAALVAVQLLRQHFTNAHLVELGCEALCSLSVEAENRVNLGDVGACELLGRLLVRYCTEPSTAQPISRAIGYVSFKQDSNIQRLLAVEDRISGSG